MATLVTMLFVNWKSTALHALLAALLAAGTYFGSVQVGAWGYVGSLLVFLAGLVQKDVEKVDAETPPPAP